MTASILDDPDLHAHVVRVVKGALSSAASFGHVSDSAYAHPNGFAKIPLIDLDDNTVVRLHYWSSPFLDDGNTHSHRWDMDSLILEGAYHATDLYEQEGGATHDKFRCSENAGGRYLIDPLGSVALSVRRARAYNVGDHYQLDAGMIHRVDRLLTPIAISLVACSRPVFDHSLIYSSLSERPLQTPSQPLADTALRQYLARAHDAMLSLWHR